MDFKNVVTMDKGRETLFKSLNRNLLGSQRISLAESLGRVLSTDIISGENVPSFPRSTVDGYAVRSYDTFGATESMPAYLTLKGNIFIGQKVQAILNPGEAMGIPTGGMIPQGADGVVMVEYTEELIDQLMVYKSIGQGENIIHPGEDMKAGDIIFKKGHRIRPQDMGALAACGKTEIDVFQRPKVGIISTGDELVPPNKKPHGGQIRDINTYSLIGLVLELGGDPINYGIVSDNSELLFDKLEESLRECDITLISGGSSVGIRDYTPKIINSLGDPGVLLHGLSIKPGKPTIIAAVDGKPIIGLPGHPVSSLVVAQNLLKPLVDYLTYQESKIPATIKGILTKNLHSAPGREDYIRVDIIQRDNEIYIDPILGKSGLITTMSKAKGLLIIPEDINGYQKGSIVEVKSL